ncbi:hypothetical protein PHYSODRAFT_292792 [Phytophthora sojae]|uniref:RxLR effector protein n=2 Tax=Phytophthora sojae TaxID=67593 RepID=G5AAD8_PHYSP|nr:hypothetical protein PHYSODRAFT_288907 [Phytophthora sojae]XP_009540021.1 hypothetical protein PHYSODRAFT_292792 [Phytophthora sojae]AEK81279.1 Avh376 [Phytophthora sojae]AEK81280.1 Avh376 [Phytophthora sojae]AEK81281.1 Avh376 [Phytophthora sojae]EGZ04525.1 hypothetical protein PHYSODRAFT_292792 [Phytophthora sojae]EGZ07567.1 hypothetical protein PHYSODRAFT_288907 [Phytophthora sojae]|eukprot:XP_009537133.1 hypothetical protein PHYSODRAFT_288907 [Phytophthora sojae]
MCWTIILILLEYIVNSDRFLRADTAAKRVLDSEDEERGIADLAKKLGTGAKAWMKDARLKSTIYWKTNAAGPDKAVW